MTNRGQALLCACALDVSAYEAIDIAERIFLPYLDDGVIPDIPDIREKLDLPVVTEEERKTQLEEVRKKSEQARSERRAAKELDKVAPREEQG